MKVLVTGAGGFLGRHVVRALTRSAHAVRAQVRDASTLNAASFGKAVDRIDIVAADLLLTADLRPMCAGIDAVIHLAASMTGSASQQLQAACVGTQRLLEHLPAGSTRVVLASSFAVYDWRRVGSVLTEASPLLEAVDAPLSGSYAVAKAAQERLARRVCAERGLRLAVLRPAMIWGAGHLGLDTVGPRVGGVQWVIAPRRHLHLTHVENCADAFVAALESGASGGTFNVEDGHCVGPLAFVDALATGRTCRQVPAFVLRAAQLAGAPFAIASRAGLRVPGLLIPVRSQARFPMSRVADSGLRAAVGWSPPYDFAQAVARSHTRNGIE